jgi:uncharacterized protein YndB with AHSA1/START domain
MSKPANNAYELSVTRYIDAPPKKVWRIMTERQEEWLCPKPWKAEIVEQDWRAGGRDASIFHGPDGEQMPQEGVFLEVIPGKRFVNTDAFTVDWRPAKAFMVGIWEIEPEGAGTRFKASARHWTKEAYDQHKEMGFEQGWSAMTDQLAGLAEAE